MKKLLITTILTSAILAGCGGGGGASSRSAVSPVTYKWQIVQLKSVAKTSLASKCVIYANSALNDGEVITAYV
ncbi:MAG: hypothetical protein OQK77_04910, partial [Psychromonas sp.]|nr:hypothetical protein [Psychromonas sp.]